MAHEENLSDYDDGFRAGVFDKCNAREDLRNRLGGFEYGRIFLDGYADGYDGSPAVMGKAPLPPLEQLMLEMATADLVDGEVTISGNGHYPKAIRDTLRFLEENNFLTVPPEPSKEDVIAYAVDAWGIDPADYQEE